MVTNTKKNFPNNISICIHYIFIQKVMQYHRQLLFSSLFAEAIINLLYYFVPKKKLQERTPKEIASDGINDSVA